MLGTRRRQERQVPGRRHPSDRRRVRVQRKISRRVDRQLRQGREVPEPPCSRATRSRPLARSNRLDAPLSAAPMLHASRLRADASVMLRPQEAAQYSEIMSNDEQSLPPATLRP